MVSPAASSAARLMRRRDDSFSIDFDIVIAVAESCRWALSASVLVLIRSDILTLPDLVRPGFLPSWPLAWGRSPYLAAPVRRSSPSGCNGCIAVPVLHLYVL